MNKLGCLVDLRTLIRLGSVLLFVFFGLIRQLSAPIPHKNNPTVLLFGSSKQE